MISTQSSKEMNTNLESCSKIEYRPTLSDKTLSQLLYICETMANAVNQKQSPPIKDVPEFEEFPINLKDDSIHKKAELCDKAPLLLFFWILCATRTVPVVFRGVQTLLSHD
jgi:hypothetical protein